MPEGVQVAISGVDYTGPAFQEAAARMQQFQTKFDAIGGSFREAHASARLFSEELGVHMSRELTNIVAKSELLRGALTVALPLAAAAGFLEIAARIPDAIKKMTDGFVGFSEASKKVMDEAVAANEKIYGSFTKVAEGYRLLTTMHAQQDELQNKSVFPSGPSSISKQLLGPAGGLWDYVSQLQTNIQEKTKLTLQVNKDVDTVVGHLGKLFDENNAKLKTANEQFAKLLEASQKLLDRTQSFAWNQVLKNLQPEAGYMPKDMLAGDIRQYDFATSGISAQAALYSGSTAAKNLADVQMNQSDAIKAAQQIYEQTATATEKYGDQIDVLVALLNQGRISQQQFSAAALAAGNDLTRSPYKKYYEELGKDIGRTVEQAVLFQTSWSKALKALLADLVKVTLEMYVFRNLASEFGGSGTFLGSLFTGLAGQRAGGGPVNSGMAYLTGENGPEIFVPGSSGSIVPNSALGGGQTVYQDFRGAVVTDDLMRRGEALGAIRVSENRAVARAISGVADMQARK